MNAFQKDVMVGLMFLAGVISFISGQFIISTVLFASSAILSNVFLNQRFFD